jgi:PEP-CTERM motif
MSFKAISFAIATAALMGAAISSPANASIIISGNTEGCFGVGCIPGAPGAITTDNGLAFIPTSFFTTTNNTGFASISNLGGFTLNGTPHDYDGDAFTLEVSFASPIGTSPNAGLFGAVLVGSVTDTGTGGVFINFSPNTESFDFSGGSFTLQLNSIGPQPGSELLISAEVQAVPEPGTWALMGIGFACLGLMAYRRRGSGPTLRFV